MELKHNVTELGLKMLEESYYYKDESSPIELYTRVAMAGADDKEHAQRLIRYMIDQWFSPATPVLANLGTERGYPISCFTNNVPDDKQGIFKNFQENFNLGSHGGGIGTRWSDVREVGAKVGNSGVSGGIIPFIKSSDSNTLAISQGGLRRASQAVYLDVDHPEIEEFIEMRKPTGRDHNRLCSNIHHGVVITDDFMQAVHAVKPWALISRKDGSVVKTVDALTLFQKILTARIEHGEPYILFIDTVNRNLPDSYKHNNMRVLTSNLCSEITLATEEDYSGVCCLSSLNLVHFDAWEEDPLFIEDVVRFLDNVLSIFIEQADGQPGMQASVNSAKFERSIGLGTMGYHSYFQKRMLPLESSLAVSATRNIYKHIRDKANDASERLGVEKGCPPIFNGMNNPRRNANLTAIAPTSSISILAGEVSAGIDPILANAYVTKNKVGASFFKNKQLEFELDKLGLNTDTIWKKIKEDAGSVQNIPEIPEEIKEVFKTAYELDPVYLLELASHRQLFIDQAQSVNLFLPNDISAKELYYIHRAAWLKELKSLYYLRSTAPTRATVGNQVTREIIPEKYEECLSCQ